METIGDCYVAVSGLPEPRKDHAVAMCRFAWECLLEMDQLMEKLYADLGGSDTLDLKMRIGIHSGPVTAVSTDTSLLLKAPSAIPHPIYVSSIVLKLSGSVKRQKAALSTFW